MDHPKKWDLFKENTKLSNPMITFKHNFGINSYKLVIPPFPPTFLFFMLDNNKIFGATLSQTVPNLCFIEMYVVLIWIM